jgi:diguanylate cyclase (GGDEF)-like protein
MPTNILVIDDSTNVREKIVATLRDAGLFDEYREAADGLEGVKALLDRRADLVLCDLEMPRMDGFKFISLISSRAELQDIPVILLTGREDREMKIKGLEQGAVDYVTKPFDEGELIARVKVQMKIKKLQDDLKKTNELLVEISNTDPLTGLYNRRYLMENLNKEFHRVQRNNGCLAFIILDLDHFKAINDTYGHQQGDMVLAEVARQMHKHLRSYDIAARYGGEEFVAVLPESNREEALLAAERLRFAVESLGFAGKTGNIVVTISLGVSVYPSERVDCVDSLIRQADEALYHAKRTGRNRVESFCGKAA